MFVVRPMTHRPSADPAVLATAPGSARENWPQWRGPGGQGISTETQVPTEWAPDKNVVVEG